ncbi:MAG: hypothetical protein LUD46_14485 [Parabacteroides sp.]|nr:hypothetical protein [Parabacteroides sp.]
MIQMKLIEAFAFSAPIVCAMICMVMMLMDAHASFHNLLEKRLRMFLALAYLISALGWLGMVFFVISPPCFCFLLYRIPAGADVRPDHDLPVRFHHNEYGGTQEVQPAASGNTYSYRRYFGC